MTEHADVMREPVGSPVLHIDNFDGPLDLLWDLIKKARIDVTEVSISRITEQYIEYLRLMETLNVRVASDFIEMASELLLYKSRALLPSPGLEDEYFVPPMPPELVQKLLEFKRYQQASRRLLEAYESRSDRFTREHVPDDVPSIEEYVSVTLFDLLKAFAQVMESDTSVEEKEIIFDEVLVSDAIDRIRELLASWNAVHFTDIFATRPTRMEVVVAFIAVLEMARTREIRILQHRMFGTIRIMRAA